MATDHKDKLPGGLADKKKPEDFDQEFLDEGVKVELEHTKDEGLAREIAMDHLSEDKDYYKKLKTIEKSEAWIPKRGDRVRVFQGNPSHPAHHAVFRIQNQSKKRADEYWIEPEEKYKEHTFGGYHKIREMKPHEGEDPNPLGFKEHDLKIAKSTADRASALLLKGRMKEFLLSELEKGLNGDWKKEGYTFKAKYCVDHPEYGDDCIEVTAHHPKHGKVATSIIRPNSDGTWEPTLTMVNRDHRRKGIAKQMYAEANKLVAGKVNPSGHQTNGAKKLWQNMDKSENLKDRFMKLLSKIKR